MVLADTFFWVNSTSPCHFLFYIPKAFRIEKRFGSGCLAIVDKKVVLLPVSAQFRRRGNGYLVMRKTGYHLPVELDELISWVFCVLLVLIPQLFLSAAKFTHQVVIALVFGTFLTLVVNR